MNMLNNKLLQFIRTIDLYLRFTISFIFCSESEICELNIFKIFNINQLFNDNELLVLLFVYIFILNTFSSLFIRILYYNSIAILTINCFYISLNRIIR